tara:strand:- start:100 stop:753 length:654 start_codon:yes stop_codon:yes gene_type:complete
VETLYPICRYLQGLTLKAFSNYKVNGKENVPPMGPLLIVSNHLSYVDPSVLSNAIPRRLRFLAKDTIFRGFPISQMLKAYGAHPINRGGVDIAAIRWARTQLSEDGALVMFPEGTRSDGSLIRGQHGVVTLIRMTGATILPVGITGTERLKLLLRIVNPTGNITVNIGTPFSLPPVEGRINKSLMKSMTDIIMERIAALLPKSYRGVYESNTHSQEG